MPAQRMTRINDPSGKLPQDCSRTSLFYSQVLAQWSTIVSPDKGEWSLCQWRWIIGFNGTGQARCISLTGSVISEPPPADEGLLKIVLLTVQSKYDGPLKPTVL